MAYTIWRAMYGNGAMTGLAATVRVHKQTQLDLEQVVIVCFAAAAGPPSPAAAVYRSAAATSPRTTGTPASDSVLSWA